MFPQCVISTFRPGKHQFQTISNRTEATTNTRWHTGKAQNITRCRFIPSADLENRTSKCYCAQNSECVCVCAHVWISVDVQLSIHCLFYICTWTTHRFWYMRMYSCMKKNLKKYSTTLFDAGREWHCTFNFFGEFYPLGVREGAFLFLYILHVKHLAHELYDWLGLVECCGWHWNIIHRQ